MNSKNCCEPNIKEYHHCNPRCIGFKKFVLGILILLNVVYNWLDWASFIGWLLVILGLLKMLIPMCLCNRR